MGEVAVEMLREHDILPECVESAFERLLENPPIRELRELRRLP